MNTNYQDLTQKEVQILKDTLESKYSMLVKSFTIMVVIMILIFLYQQIRWHNASIPILLIVCSVIYTPFFCFLWFGNIAKIKKDITMRQKLSLKAKVIDKINDNVLGIQEISLILDHNEAGIKKININQKEYDSIPLFSIINLSVSKNSKTYLSSEIIK